MSVWTSLLQNAIHSPSPHNVQPWRVRILSDNEADLLIDSQRTLPKEDPSGSFIILTMGIFIEALRLLAANQGWRLDHSLHHEPAWYAQQMLKTQEHTFFPFARMSLSRDESVLSAFDPALLLKRRTSRISLRPDLVPDNTVQQFKELAHKWDQRYEQTSDPLLIERILEKGTEAVFADLNNRDYHDEIVEWFRFTDASAEATRDGLDYRCMNTSRSSYWLTARFPKLLQLPVARSLLARKYRNQVGLVPTIGMLAGDFWDSGSAFAAGGFLMQFWLETAKHDLYIHPFGNLVTNKAAAAWVHQTTGIDRIWLIFKIGYSREPPKSYRRSVEEILVA